MITEIKGEKKKYLDLLLLGDEQESMIDRYLERGRMFALYDGELVAQAVVTEKNGGLEINNISAYPKFQRKGYGKALIAFLAEEFSDSCSFLLAGTGDSPLTVPFYEKCGFTRSYVIKNYFTDNYDRPIYEDGVLLKDMVFFKKDILKTY